MKTLIATLLLLATTVAMAQTAPTTITIGPTPLCYGFCYNVPNSANDVIDLSPPPAWPYHTLYLSINGVAYTAPLAAGEASYTDVVALSSTGDQVLVSATWVGSRHCSSGRSGGCATVWELQSGSIVLP